MNIQIQLTKKLEQLQQLKANIEDSIKATQTVLGLYDTPETVKIEKIPKVKVVSFEKDEVIPKDSPTEAVRYFINQFDKGATVRALEISKHLQEYGGYTATQIYPPINELLKQGELKRTKKKGVYKKS